MMSEREAEKLLPNEYIYTDDDSDYTACIVLFKDGIPYRFIASEGGEPEDQIFCRDLGWILPELNKALKLGKE